jgi:GT2 family glycosyltransferase
MLKVGFVCTNYNNAQYTWAFVTSLLAKAAPRDVHVAIVDNKSRDEDVESLRELGRQFPTVDILLQGENLGYFPGLNVGIRHLRTTFPEMSHIVVGNNDLVFPTGFVDTVRRHRDVFEAWAVVAPDIVTFEGLHQNPHVLYPVSRARRLVWDVYHRWYALAVLIRLVARVTKTFTSREELSPESTLHVMPGPIEQGYGACYLLGPVFFEHFSRLFGPTFLLQEEYFLSEQLKSIGQMTYYDPRFVVNHRDHATMGLLGNRRSWLIERDAYRVYRRFLKMRSEQQIDLIGTFVREISDEGTGLA